MNSTNELKNYRANELSRGFTLIEILIYMAIMSITIGASLTAVFNLLEGSGKLNSTARIEEEANFIFKKLEWAFGDASAILNPAAGSSGQSVSVTKTGFDENPIVFGLSSGNITMQTGGGQENALNSESIEVNALTFQHIASDGEKPEGLRSSFTLNGKEYATLIYLRQ